MSELIRENILSFNPRVEFADRADGLAVTVKPCCIRGLLEHLRTAADLQFDYLLSLTGMDWGESGLGVVYHLESTVHNHAIVVRVAVEDRLEPHLPSVCDIWRTAELNEREVFDYFGISFTRHPDMRRLFLRDDWVGYPLRKDYDASRETNPVRMTNETASDLTSVMDVDAEGHSIEKQQILFDDAEYVINIGPQHPATHGVLRFRVSLEGEIIRKLDVHCGYIHRGIEKMCESLTYPQILALTERLDYLSAMQSRHAMCLCVEGGLGLEVPPRARYIRTIMDELQRIDSHLLFFSCLCMDLGALTTFFYGFRDREKILDIFEETTGGRLLFHYNIIGGVQADLHPDFESKVRSFLSGLSKILKEYHDVFTGNVIARHRMEGVGILSRESAISFGTTGGTGRASGWSCDVRKRHPYGAYGDVKFREILYEAGDCYARYLVRMDEIVESASIIEQLLDRLPDGDIRVPTKAIIRLPEGAYWSSVESSRGEFGVYIESRGDKFPYRVKFRSTGLPLVGCMDELTRGSKIADLIAIGGTLDYIVPDIDR